MSTINNDDRNSGVNFVTDQYVVTKAGVIGLVVYHTATTLTIQWEDSSAYGQTIEPQQGVYPRYFRVINLPPHAKAQHPCTVPTLD